MGRREREGKTANGLCGKPVRSLARDMGGMVVENDLNRGVGGVSGIQELYQLDEFPAAAGLLYQGMGVAGDQSDTPPPGPRNAARVFVCSYRGLTDPRELTV